MRNESKARCATVSAARLAPSFWFKQRQCQAENQGYDQYPCLSELTQHRAFGAPGPWQYNMPVHRHVWESAVLVRIASTRPLPA